MNRVQKYLGKPTEKDDRKLIYKVNRKFSHLTIANVDVSGSDVDEAFIMLKLIDNDTVFMLSEIPCLECEIKYIQKILTDAKITISAIHNHWIYCDPQLLYVHCQARCRVDQVAQHILPLWSYISKDTLE